MTTNSALSSTSMKAASWLPLIVVVLTQIQASFAVNTLTVSMAGISSDLGMPATSIGTAITTGTFAMAAFILLGAKIGARFGTRRVFQIAVVVHAASMAAIALSVSPAMLFIAQAASGAVIALIAPALVVFISTNYSGAQQAKAIGYLAAAIPAAGVLALLIAGSFASTIGWRWSFVLIAVLGAVNLVLSFRFQAVPAQKDLSIDIVGALLAAASIILLSFGFSGLTSWGVVVATPNAPFEVLGISPALILLVLGAFGGQCFFLYLRRRKAAGRPQIFDLDVLKSGAEKATTFCMAAMLFIGTAANFLIPLYIQVVQGRSSIETSLSIIPYTISIFVANSVVASFYERFAPRRIAQAGFIVVALALTLIAFTVRNDWGQIVVVIGLILLGLGQGAIVALVFNTLLSSAPKRIAGDVGAWRGLVHNISGSVGIAVMTVFAVGMLSSFIAAGLVDHPGLPPELQVQVPLDSVNFVVDDRLRDVLSTTDATAAQVDEAVLVNALARLQALKVSLLVLAGIALLAIIPAGRMPARMGDEPAADSDED
ncbi:MFS family permease [Microbacterium proteolyticum]|uniref:MFS family permease n=1 Tax=Microbacterium proteolyticum TaxID=1572644 RepID=A0A7W5GFI2_9MICO|nr:MFS transporter [Microbacterium proteolyticum]MBB3157855.1 MFS family permease [Microbacterium proteolyticum]